MAPPIALALLVDGRRRAASPGRAQPPCSPDLSDSWARCVKPLLGPARAAGERGVGPEEAAGALASTSGRLSRYARRSPPLYRRKLPAGGLRPDRLRRSTVPEAEGRSDRLRCHRAAPTRPCRTSPPVAGPGWRGSARGQGEGGGRRVPMGERIIIIITFRLTSLPPGMKSHGWRLEGGTPPPGPPFALSLPFWWPPTGCVSSARPTPLPPPAILPLGPAR